MLLLSETTFQTAAGKCLFRHLGFIRCCIIINITLTLPQALNNQGLYLHEHIEAPQWGLGLETGTGSGSNIK